METGPTVRIFDGNDQQQIDLSAQILQLENKILDIGRYDPRRMLLRRRLGILKQNLDKRAIELGNKSKYTSGSHG